MERVRAALSLAADVSRSDVFLLTPGEGDQFCVAIHAQPHSMASLYGTSPVGRCYHRHERRWLGAAVANGLRSQRVVSMSPEQGPEVRQQVWPIFDARKKPMAAMAVYTNAIERERHRRRDPAFQRALSRFLNLVAEGMIDGAENLPPFREQDGIVFVDHAARYRYLSGQANNIYRRLGYLDDLRGRTLDEVAAGDLELVQRAWNNKQCVFSEETVRRRILLRRVAPLLGPPDLSFGERVQFWRKHPHRYGALILVTDATETRRKAQELRVKGMMLKEMHHRVKNNLQMLVSIMRIQARRAQTEEARQLLQDAIHRILSMSVIHESLSEGEGDALNLADVIRRILAHLQQSTVGPGQDIRIGLVHADDVILPTNKATICALVVNELMLNAIEHGFDKRIQGQVWVYLYDRGEQVEFRIVDNGLGLPNGFSFESESSLGLDIVRTLVHDDLKGEIELTSRPGGGTQAVVCFPNISGGQS
ncbi:MAG: hypothetical protein GXP42_10545 [Chloroflexi bacterium]|nr:hypothetical protein [Chloroflexota bacterium]